MAGRMVLRRDGQGQVRFNLLDEDGTVLTSSKGFDSVEAARAGAERATALMAEPEIIDQTEPGHPVHVHEPTPREPDDG